MIPYNPEIVLDKVRELLPCPRESTPTPTPSHIAPQSVQKNPRIVRQLAEVATEIMMHPACSGDLVQMVSKFVKGAVAEVRKGDLLEQRWEQQTAAQTARKARKRESNKILHRGGVLTVGEARSMVRDREEVEEEREKERGVAWEKRYCTVPCQKFPTLPAIFVISRFNPFNPSSLTSSFHHATHSVGFNFW